MSVRTRSSRQHATKQARFDARQLYQRDQATQQIREWFALELAGLAAYGRWQQAHAQREYLWQFRHMYTALQEGAAL